MKKTSFTNLRQLMMAFLLVGLGVMVNAQSVSITNQPLGATACGLTGSNLTSYTFNFPSVAPGTNVLGSVNLNYCPTTWTSDWDFDIISPTGVITNIVNPTGAGSQGGVVNITVLDNSPCASAFPLATTVLNSIGSYSGTLRSATPFPCLPAGASAGVWQLRVRNIFSGEPAFLTNATLNFVAPPAYTSSVTPGAVTGGSLVSSVQGATTSCSTIDTVNWTITLTPGSSNVAATIATTAVAPATQSTNTYLLAGPYTVGRTRVREDVVCYNPQKKVVYMLTVLAPPSVICPPNKVVTLEPGACKAQLAWSCPTSSVQGTQPGPQFTQQAGAFGPVNNSLACGIAASKYGRLFDPVPAVTSDPCNPSGNTINVTQVQTGAWSAGTGTWQLRVWEYTGPAPTSAGDCLATGSLVYGGNLTLAGSSNFTVGGSGPGTAGFTANLATPITIQRGKYYFAEIVVSGGGFLIGTNGVAETRCSYFSSDICTTGIPNINPIPMAAAGFGFIHVGLNLNTTFSTNGLVQTSGPKQDSLAGPGIYNICYQVTDATGQTATCCFSYEVRAYAGPISNNLTCNDFLNVSLDTLCSAVLGADMFLEGGPYKCYDNYRVQMSNVSMNGPWRDNVGCGLAANAFNDNKIHLCPNDLGKTYWYRIVDLANTQNSCWGQFKVEDKVAPKLTCPADQTIACDVPLEPSAQPTGELCSASINASGSTVAAPANIPLTINSTNLYYNAVVNRAAFTVKVRGSAWIGDLRSRLVAPNGAIYNLNWTQNIGPGAFGCADPAGDLTFDNGSSLAPANVTCAPFITATIRPENQILLPSGVDACGYRGAGSSYYGTWTLQVGDNFPGDALGNVQLCLSITPSGTQLPNGLRLGTLAEYSDPTYWAGVQVPGFDNGVNAVQIGPKKYRVKAGLVDACTEAILTYNDVISDSTCTATRNVIKAVTRTWTATDATGNTARCTQKIAVTKADIANLIMPSNWDGQPGSERVLNICTDFWPNNYDLCGTNPLGYGHGTTKWVRKSNGYPAAKVSEVLNDGQDIGGGCANVKIYGNDAYVIGEFDPFHDPLNPGTDTLCLRGTGMPSGATCSTINMLYNDTPLPTCGDGYKLLRDWRILDWCNGQIRNHTQVIKVQDMTAPVVTCPASVTVSTDGLDCTGSGAFPAPKMSDVCSSTSYDIYYDPTGSDPLPSSASITKLADGSYRYNGFTCGNFNFRYVVSDVCGNRSECTGFKMTVRDITVPVAVCRTVSEVTLTNTVDDPTTSFKECGLTRVDAIKFDEGSWDNCGPVYFKAKRVVTPGLYDNNPNFDDYVYFNCDDVGLEREVILRVYDQQPVVGHVPSDSYRPANTCGSNFNDCIVKVNVKDLVNPTLTCPSNITINCNAYDFNIPLAGADTSWFNKYLGKINTTDCNGINAASQFTYFNGSFNTTGNNGSAFDNCFVSIQQTITAQIDCGIGTISRQFRAVDRGGRSSAPCTQLIYVINNTPFNINTSQYTDPGNDLADPCDGTERFVNYKVDYIKDPVDVANGFTDPAVTPLTQDDIIWPDQYVEIENCQGKDSIGTSCEKGKGAGAPRFLRNNRCDLLGITYSDEFFPIELPACKKIIRTWTVVDWCQDKPAGRRWTYQQFIKFTNKVAPNFTGNTCNNEEICQYPVDCGPDPVTLSASAEDDCTPAGNLKYRAVIDLNNDGTVDLTGSGASVTITKNNGLKYGRHMITWSVEDGCGNVKTCTKTFLVKDCKRPTPVAKLLSIELMPNLCMAIIEASKVNNFSWDNCTPMTELRFRLAKSGTYTANMTLDEVLALDDKVTFTGAECGTQSVALFVIDNDGNFDYTETVIIVQSNLDPNCCGTGGGTVTGTIKTETGEDVQDVKILINGTNLAITPASGLFNLLLAKGGNITVAPEKDINPMNGVSTADLVAINKHILGISSLNSAYKQIAADVNKDKRISTADMVELRKMILYIQNNFSNNKSWRFVDKSYNFTTSNPLTENFNESINFSNLQASQTANFIAAKIGDVNGSAKANEFLGGEERGNGTLVFDAENATLAAGETKTIEFKAADIANIGGYQFTMNFDKDAVEVLEMAGTDMTANNFGMLLNEGAITTSFDGKVSSDVVFTMTVKAKKNVQLSDVISVGSRFTAAEAYTLNGDKMDVALSFNGKVAGTFELFQNQPNPFNGKTVVGFTMPQEGAATITVFDAAGRTVKVVNMKAVKGYNQVIVDKSELGATGVLSYRLTTAGFSATKQMIVTE